MRKFIHFLKVWDGVWSVPLAIFAFMGAGYAIVAFFGPEAGSMLPVYLQRLFYAALCMVICNFIVLFGLYMNFRGMFHYYLEDSCKEFKDMDSKFKLKVFIGLYFMYFLFFTSFLILV